MKRKWFKEKAAFVLIFILIVAGCGSGNSKETVTGGGNSAASKQRIELSMLSSWSTDTERGRALQAVVEKFNQENEDNITVKLDINADWPSLQQK